MAPMRVLVTGGTGFVGGHITAAAVRAGHDVRLLARRKERVATALQPLGVAVDDVVVGDVLDEDAVRTALDGCDAVVHAAGVFSQPGRAEAMLTTNARAAELVLGLAVEAGLDPAVHISSTVALVRRAGSGPDLPLGDVDGPYCRSKIAAERAARSLQDAGAPVVCIYPGAVYGPHDPYRGEHSERLRWQLRGLFPVWPGATHAVDVRDVARTVVAVLEPGRGPRRYVVPGHHLDARLMYGALARVTGRRLPHAAPPEWFAVPMARLAGALQRPLPDRWRYPADAEGAELSVRATRFDDSPARTELGIEPMDFDQSLRDTVAWLVASGRVRARWAGSARM